MPIHDKGGRKVVEGVRDFTYFLCWFREVVSKGGKNVCVPSHG